jgi:phosphoserine aminotransferase
MNNVFLTVGPSQLYPTVPRHTLNAIENHVFSMSHTGKDFVDIYQSLTNNLRNLFDIPSTHHIFFTGSSTESMHTIIASTVKDKSLHLITGGFSKKFYKAALDLHKHPSVIELSWDEKIDFTKLSIPNNTELLCITENDTSIGMQIPLASFREIKKLHPSTLLAVDIVSSVPFVKVDYSYIDMAFFSVHKGMGLPAGLGILIANDASIQKAHFLSQAGYSIGGHHSLASLAEKAATFKTPETPNVYNVYLLEKVTADMFTYGIDTIRDETIAKSKLIYDYFDGHDSCKPLISRKIYRSKTTPVINVQGQADNLSRALAKKGYQVSKGYRPYEDDHMRIANFPAHTLNHIEGLLEAMSTIRVK